MAAIRTPNSRRQRWIDELQDARVAIVAYLIQAWSSGVDDDLVSTSAVPE
jgi:hypothetical protein